MDAFRHARRLTALLVLVVSFSGCDATPTVSPTARPSIEVTPAAVLLTGIGDTKVLKASRPAGGGPATQLAASWTSSNPAIVAVDASGTVRATRARGTALIRAAVGDRTSDPVYVTVASPVAGALLIGDDAVVAGPTLVPTDAEPTAATPYEVVLRGVASPAVGTIVIGAEGRSIGGRVVSAVAEGADMRVRLAGVPPTELFTDFEFADSLDLAAGPFEVDPDLAATYDVSQDGNSFSFTPKSASSSGTIVAARWHPAARSARAALAVAQGTQALPAPPPFKECEVEVGFAGGSELPLSLTAPPTFSLNAAGSVDFHSTPAATTLAVHATPTVKLASELEIKAAFEAKVECKLTLVRRKFRVPGWAGLFFGGDVEFGVGFEVGGKVTLLSAKVGGQLVIKPDLSATVNCPAAADCALTGGASATSQLTPTLQAPSLSQAQFEPSLNLFGFVSLEAGNADIEKLQFQAIEAKAGAELGASLALEALQIDNRDTETGRSRYELALKAEVGPGIKLGEFLTYLGLAKVIPLKLAFEVPLGSSPTGTARSDKPRYLPGEHATVHVKLDPGSIMFPAVPTGIGLYNVDHVVLRHKTGLLSTEVLAEQAASDGQTDFELDFTSEHVLDASEIFAFVVTRLLPLDPPTLELGSTATGPGRIAFGTETGLYVVNADGSKPQRLTSNPARPGVLTPDTDPAWSPDGSKIAFTRVTATSNEIDVMDADGSNLTRLTGGTATSLARSPSWSPDGKHIAFTGSRPGGVDIYVMDADGSNEVRLTEDPGGDAFPAWSPDGKRIAFESTRPGQIEIYVMNADGSGETRLTTSPGNGTTHGESIDPAWSPDGSLIAFARDVDHQWEIFVMGADGSGLVRLTSDSVAEAYPAWSPDGSLIAYSRGTGTIGSAIYLMSPDGSGQRPLSSVSTYAVTPAWSPR
jgi:hypothetical protein